jgi:hypothetical protein
MKEDCIFVKTLEGVEREIDWPELNNLKKDILWFFDENLGDPVNSFVPDYSFTLPYWEYLNIDGGEFFYKEERDFLKEGCLTIINGMICEYVHIPGGSRKVFHDTKIEEINQHIGIFIPANEKQGKLKKMRY